MPDAYLLITINMIIIIIIIYSESTATFEKNKLRKVLPANGQTDYELANKINYIMNMISKTLKNIYTFKYINLQQCIINSHLNP
jgi:hypothetical protein